MRESVCGHRRKRVREPRGPLSRNWAPKWVPVFPSADGSYPTERPNNRHSSLTMSSTVSAGNGSSAARAFDRPGNHIHLPSAQIDPLREKPCWNHTINAWTQNHPISAHEKGYALRKRITQVDVKCNIAVLSHAGQRPPFETREDAMNMGSTLRHRRRMADTGQLAQSKTVHCHP